MTYVIFSVVNLPTQKLVAAAFISLIVIAAVSIGIMVWWITAVDRPDYVNVEIREYEGQDLSSISAFRENSIRGPQQINIEDYSLNITGLVNTNLTYTYDEIVNSLPLQKKVVTLHCVEGWSVTIFWEGFLVKDLIEAAGIDPNANTVIFYAVDSYSTALPLDYVIDNNLIIAYKMNNVTLPPERGFPFQLVAESKWGYKWIKWLTEIELSDNESYLGYWERRGYPNDANLGEPLR
jgi:DMSO/TMAO reductase YedYZ molybdopterin-dependent catalytic subunit